MTRGCMSRFFARTLAAAAAALLIAAGAGTDARADAARPNIVLIVSDDEDVAIHAHMPKTKALIEDQGTRFDQFFVSYPLCCPSRASGDAGFWPIARLLGTGSDSSRFTSCLRDAQAMPNACTIPMQSEAVGIGGLTRPAAGRSHRLAGACG